MMNVDIAFAGAWTALVTPFGADGRFDRARFEEQIERQIEGGVQGVVPMGTTGESPTVTHEEHIQAVRAAVEIVQGRVKVVAGAGSNSTDEAIGLTKAAEEVGADAILHVSPYYNRPSQRGLVAHFKAIADSTGLPIILYNIPGRCGVDLLPDTVCELAEGCSNIAGIKEASGSTDRVTELRSRLGPGFAILSGDDSLTLPFMAAGADGVVSVASNIIPAQVAHLASLAQENNFDRARKMHAQMFDLTKALFLDGNPAGVKCAMKMLGWDSGILRLPLVEVSEKTEAAIGRALSAFKLL